MADSEAKTKETRQERSEREIAEAAAARQRARDRAGDEPPIGKGKTGKSS